MISGYQEALQALKNLETPKRRTDKIDKINADLPNTPPSLREGRKKPKTQERPTAKIDKITSGYKNKAEELGLIACWSHEFGYVSLHDPTTGEWCDLQTKDAPGWSLTEARKRKELYRDGNHRAYRLTSREMEEIWESEQPQDEGIVEEHPPEEGDPYL